MQRSQRNDRGHSIIELGLLSGLFVVIAAFCMDVCFVLLGSQLNDRACRDAARAAAQANDRTTALSLAQAALAVHYADGYFVAPPELVTEELEYEDFAGQPPANTSAYVSVTTRTAVRVPAPIFLFGVEFGNNQTLEFRRTYNFPIVKTKLYL